MFPILPMLNVPNFESVNISFGYGKFRIGTFANAENFVPRIPIVATGVFKVTYIFDFKSLENRKFHLLNLSNLSILLIFYCRLNHLIVILNQTNIEKFHRQI